MTQKPLKNIAASVRQRLLNKSRNDVRPFQEIVQYYAMERFLYRLSQSQHVNRFILKGALLLQIWEIPGIRTTMDIDLLGRTNSDVSLLISIITDILSVDSDPDGLSFFPKKITAERITEDAEYEGVRIWFPAKLDTMSLNMQIDIGFGDIIHPGPEESKLPSMLGFPSPRLLCYSRESSISEKFEAMLKLRELNSRMKDFYDIWLFSRHFGFEGKTLSEAIRLTLFQRGTELPDEIVAFSHEFIAIKQIQWNAFRKKLQQDQVPAEFESIVMQVKKFLGPIASNLVLGKSPPKKWSAPGPWV
ncbi:MAG: nucleotidyl transferase AbiEii/AbiGii toxin family protein [Desulfobacteraceae bacterium]|nr:MAG: nucleotidyl transferase AbiEii/AbiGii toxin family protein [Desulfobacteraceae bacterium]